MSLMPSNDDLKRQLDAALKGDATTVADMPGDQADHTATEMTDETDYAMPQGFAFFQKNKCTPAEVRVAKVAQAGAPQVMAFVARLDNAMAGNNRNQRHIAELMGLMSDIAETLTPVAGTPRQQTLWRSKWLFYGCLAVVGLGWFFLFPLGQNVLLQIVNFFIW
ncbi:hypothetical protein OAN83_04005 [Alphaproteobacteria bacterium]|nr:hypothetical protein [Alphaproteobacteria bacterium]